MADCILLNAGVGERYGAKTPKQYAILGCRPIYTYAIAKIRPLVDRLIVVTDPKYFKTIKIYDPKAILVAGGATRQESVSNGLKLVKSDKLVIHETVRPLVTQKQIKDGIRALDRYAGASYFIPFVETVCTHSGGKIKETLNREQYRELQCPQFFRTRVLKEAHNKLKDKAFTDDTRLMREMGHDVKLIKGGYNLMKLTYPEDLAILEALKSG